MRKVQIASLGPYYSYKVNFLISTAFTKKMRNSLVLIERGGRDIFEEERRFHESSGARIEKLKSAKECTIAMRYATTVL